MSAVKLVNSTAGQIVLKFPIIIVIFAFILITDKRLKNIKSLLCFFLLVVLTATEIYTQDSSKSLAFKDNKPPQRRGIFYQPDPAYQLWQQFQLIKAANSGDPIAQHELGIRYLLGLNIPADTLKGAYWIRKAAESNIISAQYNLGILYMNGWGVNWNPFEAFRSFYQAAKNGMKEAQYAIGLFYTDNLIVKRNWQNAFYWLGKSAASGYEPALKMMDELKDKVPASVSLNDSLLTAPPPQEPDILSSSFNNDPVQSSLGLVFIDFENISDTIQTVTDSMLTEDMRFIAGAETADSNSFSDSSVTINEFGPDELSELLKAADAGSPEALAVLGRMYEKGITYKKNLLTAAAYYIRGVRMDSPKAALLLWEMVQDNKLMQEVAAAVQNEDPEAMYVWYSLYDLGFNQSIVQKDAFELLQKSAARYYLPAVIELGQNYYTGKMVQQDKERAVELWKYAYNSGNIEAGVRLASAVIYDNLGIFTINKAIEILKNAESNGSVLAQVTIANCYESGIGLKKDPASAVKYYRYSAQRGNRFAYEQLVRLYDERRPDDELFRIN